MSDILSAEATTRLLRDRRSVFTRDLTDAPIARADLELMLENAHWAPTHGRTEPWHFVVFEGDARARLGEAHASIYKKYTPEPAFKADKYAKLRRRPTECGAVIGLGMVRGTNPKIPEIEEVEAVASAVQNLALTVHSLGLGGYWSSGGMTYHPALRDWMGLGPDDLFLGFFMLGHTREGYEAPAGRRNSHWDAHVRWEGA